MTRKISPTVKNIVIGRRKTPTLSYSRSVLTRHDDQYKFTIQTIINDNYFKGEDQVNEEIVNSFSQDSLNKRIKYLRDNHRTNFTKLFTNKIAKIGPGELLLYYLIDTCFLSPDESHDLTINNIPYEVKAVSISEAGNAYEFKTGNTPYLSPVIGKLLNLKADLKIPGNTQTAEATVIKEMRKKAPSAYSVIEDEYRDLIYTKYFKDKCFIFLLNKTLRLGEVVHLGQIQKNDISIYRYSGGTIHPQINL